MSEWWTYRLSDFLMFSARSYRRLFELYNAEVWPAHLVALAVGLALGIVAARGRPWAARAACTLLAAGWLWVAWAFLLQRLATIHWAAAGFALAFGVQGLLLLAGAACGTGWRVRAGRGGAGKTGLGLLLFAVLVQPALGLLFHRPWSQAEVFGLAPDPTVVATLGALLMLRPLAGAAPAGRMFWRLLWPVPLAWCLFGGATLWTLQAPDALLMPGAALLAVLIAGRDAADRAAAH